MHVKSAAAVEAGAAVRTAMVQLVLTTAVVVSFLVATLLTQARARALAPLVDGIVGNAVPSIELLSDARHAARRLATATAAGTPTEASRAAIRERLRDLDASIAAYHLLPALDGEAAHFAVLQRDADELRGVLETTLLVPGRGATADELARVARLVDATDEALDRLVRFNTMHARRPVDEVHRVRFRVQRWTHVADTVSVLLATVAACVAFVVQRRIARESERERDQAEQRASISEARADELEMFASRVAHDLLSPLSSTAMALALVQKRAGDVEGVPAAVGRGMAGLLRVRATVDGLLEFARAGAQRPSGARSSVFDVVRSALDGVAEDAAAKGIQLVRPESAPCEVACSEGALTSIVANLVNNAIRHTDPPAREGSSRVVVRVEHDAPRRVCRLEVEDDGPGVPEAIRPRLFEQFVSGDSRRGGLGLGLATVKRLAEGHGGACGHRPVEPHGSVFWVELPVACDGG